MNCKSFDVVFMDFYGTIADGDRHQVETTCSHVVRDHDLPVSAVELSYRWGKKFFAVMDSSNHDRFRTLFECECVSLIQTLADFHIETDPTPYAEELRSYWRNPPLHADAREALLQIPLPVCVVSNVDHDDLLNAISIHGLSFQAALSSEQARSYKPDRIIFEQALARMQVSAQRCLHVGDSLHSDVFGAQSVGISAVWIERDGRISDIGEAEPDYTIKSLLELINILK